MESDLRQFYGVRLADWFGPEPPSWRELYVLVSQLPEDSRVGGRWGISHELSAIGVELTHALLVAVLGIGGVKDLPDPLHIPRPYMPDRAEGRRKGRRRRPPGGKQIRTLGDLQRHLGQKQ